MVELSATNDGSLAFTVLQRLDGHVGGDQTGAAGSVDRYAGAAKVEMVGDPIGNHGWHVSERPSDFRVILPVDISILAAA